MTNDRANDNIYQDDSSDDDLSVSSIIRDYHDGDPTSTSEVRKFMKTVLKSIKSEEEHLFS